MSGGWVHVLDGRMRLRLAAVAVVCCLPLIALPWRGFSIAALFVIIAVPLCRIDLALHRLPDAVVLPGAISVMAVGALLCVASADWQRWTLMMATSAGYFVALYLLALLSPSGLGFGDVKLGLLVGAVLGWFGPETVVLWFVALIPATLVSYLIERRARPGQLRGRHARVAFGPPMLGATWLVLLVLALGAG